MNEINFSLNTVTVTTAAAVLWFPGHIAQHRKPSVHAPVLGEHNTWGPGRG